MVDTHDAVCGYELEDKSTRDVSPNNCPSQAKITEKINTPPHPPTHLGLELCEELVKSDHLAAVEDQVLALDVRRTGLLTLEQVRVVAALAQLHHNVQQPHLVAVLPWIEGGVMYTRVL